MILHAEQLSGSGKMRDSLYARSASGRVGPFQASPPRSALVADLRRGNICVSRSALDRARVCACVHDDLKLVCACACFT